jgi:CoA:oxalate CoA-transferase
MVVQGLGGVMSLTGHPGGPPTRVGTSIGDITAGLFTAVGVNGALYRRAETGEGMKIDVSMLDCQIAILENAISRYLTTGEVPGPLGTRHASITPFQAFATRDAHIIIAAGNDALFARLCEAIGRAELAGNPLYATNDLRTQNVQALEDALETTLRAHDTAHWLALLETAGVPCSPINTVADALDNEQVKARNMVVSVNDDEAGECRMAGNPIKLSAYPDPATRPPMPGLDEHRDRILTELEKPPAKD